MKKFLLLLPFILFALTAKAQSVTNFSTTVITNTGRPVAGAKVSICVHNVSAPNPCTATSVPLFSDVEATHSIANPTVTDGYGNVFVFLAPGTYDYSVAGTGILTQTFKGITIANLNQIAGGTVTSVSGLTPLFTVVNPTTTPTFILSNAPPNDVFGNCTVSTAAPTYCAITAAMLPSLSSLAVTSINGLTGAVTLAAGTNITLVTSGNTITINATGLVPVASVDLTGQFAAIAPTILFSVPSNGNYLFEWNAKVTQAASSTATFGPITIGYTDPDGTVLSTSGLGYATSGTPSVGDFIGNNPGFSLLGIPILLNCKSGTNVTYSTTYASSGATMMEYNLHIRLLPQ